MTTLVGCVKLAGSLPTIAAVDPARGSKLLKPKAQATACDGRWGWVPKSQGDGDLLSRTFQALLAQDGEATAVDDARVSATGWSVGLYTRQCVTVAGDLVRPVSTVILPTPGHGSH